MNEEPVSRTDYYYVQGRKVPLRDEPQVFAVRFRSARSPESAEMSARARRLLNEEAENVAYVPHYNLYIYEGSSAFAAAVSKRLAGTLLSEAVQALGDEDPVEFAATAVRRSPRSTALSFVTRRFLVCFDEAMTREEIDALNAEHGARIIDPLGYVRNGFLLEAPRAQGERGPVALSNLYFESGRALFAHPDFIERRTWRALPRAEAKGGVARGKAAGAGENASPGAARLEKASPGAAPRGKAALPAAPRAPARDASPSAGEPAVTARDGDYLDRQWHLRKAAVEEAWRITRGSPSITVAVLDDGVDTGHPEFAGKVASEFDFQSGTADASPKLDEDRHGTACAGVAVARGVKAFGAAPGCALMPVRTPALLGVADEARMFRWACDQGADVISCSWGPPDNGGAFALVDNVRAAIRYCCTSGRGGKGIPVLFAAGNGNESVSDDGYAANPDVMAIAASTARDTKSPYSDHGPEIFLCAPSSGDAAAGDPRIFTTDRRGAAGYNSGDASLGDAAGDYTARFGGTSSATPLVAGAIGLMLSVNPALTLAEVRDILRATADRIGPASGYDASGHSPEFGHGRLNALAAVQRAQSLAGGSPAVGSGPGIAGPASVAADRIPSFALRLGDRRLYAVELATRPELLDSAMAGAWNDSNHFGSWTTGMLSSAVYTPPAGVWTRLAAAGRVWYRAHFADDAAWTNHVASAGPDAAPSVLVEAALPVSPVGTGSAISGPAQASADSAPRFLVRLGDRRLYAVELASRRELFDPANSAQRTASNHYGSWVTGLSSQPEFVPPAPVWAMLAKAGEVYYLAHFADDASWTRHTTSSSIAAAPSVSIVDEGGGVDAGGGADAGDVPAEVRYPSGAVFRVETHPQDSIDYSDPVGGGAVPLIQVRGREQELLSRNFRVGELAARGARFARISPALVEALQALRDRLGQGLVVESGYRHPALNASLGGAVGSEHIAGRAALVRGASRSLRALDIAKAALEAVPGDIGLGLGASTVHIDVAGGALSWTYQGAEMDDAQFAQWVEAVRSGVHRAERAAADEGMAPAAAVLPEVRGPARVERGAAAPVFAVRAGLRRYWALEIASHWWLLQQRHAALRGHADFYAGWADPAVGWREAAEGGAPMLFALPADAWQRLQQHGTLYFRVVTADRPDADDRPLLASSPDELAADAPSLRVEAARLARDEGGLAAAVVRSHALDDASWSERT